MSVCGADLHIHSALSPCGDEDMTPANIAAMASLKGLSVIALSDHNSARNVRAAAAVCSDYAIALLPAMELCSREEVHILCYFPDIDAAESYSEHIYSLLPPIPCQESYFGRQLVYDENDQILSSEKRLLISPADISVSEVFADMQKLNGVAVFAHVDKKSYSVLSNLGFIPPELNSHIVEISAGCPIEHARALAGNSLRFLRGSDAHYLGDIAENTPEYQLPLDNPDAEAVLTYLRSCSALAE